jgi:hypothetical protein
MAIKNIENISLALEFEDEGMSYSFSKLKTGSENDALVAFGDAIGKLFLSPITGYKKTVEESLTEGPEE